MKSQQRILNHWSKEYALVEVHDLETLGTQNSDAGFEEDKVERLRRQEEVSVDSEPVRFGRAEAKPRAQSNRRFHLLGDLIANRLQDTEDAVELPSSQQNEDLTRTSATLTPFFFMYATRVRPCKVPTLKK